MAGLLWDCARVMRLGAPVGWILLALPGFWGFAWGHSSQPLTVMGWIMAGAFWARSLGCFYNDWVDRDLDAKVGRTRHRPLVACPPSWAMLGIMTGLFFMGAGIFLYALPFSCCKVAFLGAVGAGVYPWTKRFTHYPQILLGLIFNLAVWMPACMTHSPFSTGLWILYVYGLVWTVSYDTMYAFQDIGDDGAAGIGSLALKLGPKKGKSILGVLMLCRWGLLAVLAYWSGHQGFGGLPVTKWAYGMALVMMVWQGLLWRTWDLYDPEKCGYYFRQSLQEGYGLTLWLLVLNGSL